MIRVTREDVLRVAKMAHISVEEGEIQKIAHDMQAVLNYAASLKDIAAQYRHVQELPKQINVLREDTVQSTPAETLRASFPAREGDYIAVPMILKQDKA